MHFRIPGVTKKMFPEKIVSRFFDKLLIKNAQNELLYNKFPFLVINLAK